MWPVLIAALAGVVAFWYLFASKPPNPSDLPVRELSADFISSLEVPSGITWVNTQQFKVLVALCDTFIPSFLLPEQWQDQVVESVSQDPSDSSRDRKSVV